jgi:hypothetical protein
MKEPKLRSTGGGEDTRFGGTDFMIGIVAINRLQTAHVLHKKNSKIRP